MPGGALGLLRKHDFRNLWIAQTISVFGSEITHLAVPLLAALTLGASAAEMGLLVAAGGFPVLLFGLVAGIVADRLPRRPIMVACDVARAALILLIPLAHWLGVLRIELLYAVTFLAGIFTLFFEVADQSMLPSIVERDELVEANSRIMASFSVAFVLGPALAGLLVGLLSAPVVILLDAVSFVVSALFLARIRVREAGRRPGPRRSVRADVVEGLRVAFGTPILRTLAISTGMLTFFGSTSTAVIILYLTRELGFGAGEVGLILGSAGVGYLVGTLLPTRMARRLGLGRAIMSGVVIMSLGIAIVPAVPARTALTLPLLVLAEFVMAMGGPTYDANQVSLRQAITPDAVRGRVTASLRVVIRGGVPLGALTGGLLGELIGLRATLVVAAIGLPLTLLWLWFSPVRPLRVPPVVETEATHELAMVGAS